MKLAKLLKTLRDCTVFGPTNLEVSGITDDSRKVKKGSLFVAISGLHVDAHKFIPDAIKKGAVAVVGEKQLAHPKGTYIQVKNSREALGLLASTWFGNPSQKLTVIGVTGTDGKTTTTTLIHHILKTASKKGAVISTLGAEIGGKLYETGFHVTNPESIPLQSFLAKIVQKGSQYVVLETTSHGLAQDRTAGVKFTIGVLTNITHEHLDFHKTYDAYRESKAKLFNNVKVAVLNRDDTSFEYIRTHAAKGGRMISYFVRSKKQDSSYSLHKPAELVAQNIQMSPNGMEFEIQEGNEITKIITSLLGDYNVSNILAAVATCRALGIAWPYIKQAVASFKSPVGRLERITNKESFTVFVDFAHTPNALEKVLTLLHSIKAAQTRLIAVFGCAGERDVAKRAMMGEISTRIADVSIFTAEDPRSEDANKIIDQMAKGAKNDNYIREPERGVAIKRAIDMAKAGDIIVVCGKGHEKSMAYNGTEYPWSDQEAVHIGLKGKVKAISHV